MAVITAVSSSVTRCFKSVFDVGVHQSLQNCLCLPEVLQTSSAIQVAKSLFAFARLSHDRDLCVQKTGRLDCDLDFCHRLTQTGEDLGDRQALRCRRR